MKTENRVRPSVAFVTLGCAKNEVDTAHMRERVLAAGFSLSEDPEQADAIIVNTCSFIQAATEESLDAIFEAAQLDAVRAGRAALIVSGCMPARYGDDLEAELTEAAAFVPCADEDRIVEVLISALGLDGLLGAPSSESSPLREDDGKEAQSEQTHAYVKISDGCDRWCSYCTIPLIRGRYRSFPAEDIDGEVAKAQARGVREIVLIAQDTGRWGSDLEAPSTLGGLVHALAERYPKLWFRVMYIQPEGVSEELVEAIAAHDNVCSYFDIPIQHISPRILKAMNRSGSAEAFRELAQRIRARIPDAVLRTTLIAGFPGETDEEFDELLAFVEEGIFDYVGVFPYSREEGTRAAKFAGQLSEEEKAERASILREAGDRVGALRTAERVGSTVEVLVCGREEDGQLFGRTQAQAPEVDGCVYLDDGTIGEIVHARISVSVFYEMEGERL